MRNFVPTLLLACLSAAPCLAERVGVQKMELQGKTEQRHLSLSLWYPAQEGGALEDVGGNAVFAGQPAYRDAAPGPGPYPLLMLLHGGLRSAEDSGAWMAARLAESGFILVEVNGPRPAAAKDAVNEIWKRPQDVSQALDHLLKRPTWAEAVDPARIAVAGYALGGTAALALAGGAFDTDAVTMSCADGADGPDCAWYAAQGVTPASVNTEELQRSHHDPRIHMAIAIDPEYADAFLTPSLTKRADAIRVLGLGPQDHPTSKGSALPVRAIGSASRFDAFSVCTRKGWHILAEDGGDATLCEGSATDRRESHSEIVKFVIKALSER